MSTSQKTIRLFWHHAAKYPMFLIPLLLAVPISTIAGFNVPIITSNVLQRLSQGDYDSTNVWASFGPEIIGYTFFSILTLVIGWRLIIWLIWNLEIRVVRDLSQHVFNHLMSLGTNFYANNFGGSLVSQATKLTGSYIRFADATMINSYIMLITIISTVIILAPRAPLFTLSLVAFSIAYIIGIVILTKPIREVHKLEAQAQSAQTGLLADDISNAIAIKSFATGQLEKDKFWQAASLSKQMSRKIIYKNTIRETFASSITSATSIVAFVMAIISVCVFKSNIATVFLILTFTTNLTKQLWDFQSTLRQYNKSFGDASDMIKILDLKPEIADKAQPETSKIKLGEIEFKKMGFAHADTAGQDVLFDNLNLKILPGQKIGLVGHSGSGKTTLTRLLLRFNDVGSGKILIDGQNIANIPQDSLRQAISYVPQEPLLFHRSIAENIAYGCPDATQSEITAAAQKAHAADFVEKLPHKYDTMVGERGIKLSGGQRQRIVIARAILKNAPILVLDEATSALDSESERLIQAALADLMVNRTAIVIAHRLSTVQKMDRIIVLNDGVITEQGSHQELLKLRGEYAKLWTHQSGGFIED